MSLDLSKKEQNILKCFSKDGSIVKFAQRELTSEQWEKLFNDEFIASYLACVNGANESEKVQDKLFESYKKMSRESLLEQLTPKLQPESIATFMFLVFILYNIPRDYKEMYLNKLVEYMSNKDELLECLCDNSEQLSEFTFEDINLLDDGTCV